MRSMCLVCVLLSMCALMQNFNPIRADTGFRQVKPTEYQPRLLHFHGDKKRVTIRERPLTKKSLDSSDVYILDLGLEIYQVGL